MNNKRKMIVTSEVVIEFDITQEQLETLKEPNILKMALEESIEAVIMKDLMLTKDKGTADVEATVQMVQILVPKGEKIPDTLKDYQQSDPMEELKKALLGIMTKGEGYEN